MKLKRIAALVLALVMMVPMAVSCDLELDLSKLITTEEEEEENPTEGQETDVLGNITEPIWGVQTETNIAENVDPKPSEGFHNEYCDCPTDINYDGIEFNFLAWEQETDEYTVDAINGDTINDRLFERAMQIRNDLGVKLVFKVIPGNATKMTSFVSEAKKSIDNNSGAYDSIAAYSQCAGSLARYGLYENLNTIESLHLENPWWSEGIMETTTVADKLYFATGDIATSFLYQLELLIMNTNYGAELGVSSTELQKLVVSGKWTIDKFLEVCDLGYAEFDQKEGRTSGDRFGLYVDSMELLDLFYTGAGLSYVTEKSDGLYISEDYTGSVSEDILNKLGGKLNGHDSYYIDATGSVGIEKGNALMYTARFLDLVTTLKGMTEGFAVLPAPKASEAQEEYCTAVNLTVSMYGIPIDARDKNMSGTVLESLACITSPMFTMIKYKYANTPEDADMLEIIKDGARFDFAKTYYENLGGDENGPVRVWRNLLSTSNIKMGYDPFGADKIELWNNKLKEIYKNLTNVK